MDRRAGGPTGALAGRFGAGYGGKDRAALIRLAAATRRRHRPKWEPWMATLTLPKSLRGPVIACPHAGSGRLGGSFLYNGAAPGPARAVAGLDQPRA
jgi:hypothetical protein